MFQHRVDMQFAFNLALLVCFLLPLLPLLCLGLLILSGMSGNQAVPLYLFREKTLHSLLTNVFLSMHEATIEYLNKNII